MLPLPFIGTPAAGNDEKAGWTECADQTTYFD
jgi:hypothetical protein